jgi:uncharacterized protein (DUF342 family)
MNNLLELTVSANSLEAFLTICPNGEEAELSTKDVLDYIQNRGVINGIDENAIEQMIQQKKWNEKAKIATGREPVKGTDGHIEYFFETKKKIGAKVNEDGSVDFHNLTLVENVSPKQQLAKLHPPTDGEPGQNVFGKPIPAPKGKTVFLIGGKNTAYTDQTKTILESRAEGHVKLRSDGVIEVNTLYFIKGDVGFETGDLDIKGDVLIRGDVKAGFKVFVTGNIEIIGVVEDAEITARGDVLVKSGFVGQGKGIIQAGGRVIVSFVNNQKVIAEGDIEISQGAIQADLTAGNAIIMNSGKGMLIGGIARATKYAEIDTVGNDQYIKTMLIVGITEKLETELAQIEKEIPLNIENLKKVKAKIAELASLKQTKHWSPELEQTYRSLEKLLVDLPKNGKELEKKREEIRQGIEKIRRESYIKITQKVYSGASFKVAGFSRKFENDWNAAIFRISENELVAASII